MERKRDRGDTRSEKKVKKFRLYKLITITVLVLFLLGGLLLFENEITMENLRYMVKYLDFSSSGAFSEESVIYYNADPQNDFQVFRGDLALVNPSGVTLFDRRGSAVMTDSFSMAKPTAVCGDKYLAIYDLGGHQVRVYNSFSLLFEKYFDYSVQSVSINSDGSFCVVTSQKNYRSAVFVYDRDFKQTYQWLSADKLATGAYLSDHDELSIATVQVVNGEMFSELIELKIGEKKSLSSLKFNGVIPLVHQTNDRRSVLVTDESMLIIKKGKVTSTQNFAEGSVLKVALGERKFALLQDDLSVGVNYKLRIFDLDGKEKRSHTFKETIRDIEVYNDSVFVLTHTELYVFSDGEKVKQISLDEDYSEVGAFSEDCVILCGETQAHIRMLDK